MLLQHLQKVLRRLQTRKNLPLTDHNILLQVVGRLLGNTKVLHVRRHFQLQLLADMEKMVDSVAAGEYDSRMIEDFNLLLSELLHWHWLHLNERPEINF